MGSGEMHLATNVYDSGKEIYVCWAGTSHSISTQSTQAGEVSFLSFGIAVVSPVHIPSQPIRSSSSIKQPKTSTTNLGPWLSQVDREHLASR